MDQIPIGTDLYNFHFLLFALACSVTIVIVNLDPPAPNAPPAFLQAIVIFAIFEGLYWGSVLLLTLIKNVL